MVMMIRTMEGRQVFSMNDTGTDLTTPRLWMYHQRIDSDSGTDLGRWEIERSDGGSGTFHLPVGNSGVVCVRQQQRAGRDGGGGWWLWLHLLHLLLLFLPQHCCNLFVVIELPVGRNSMPFSLSLWIKLCMVCVVFGVGCCCCRSTVDGRCCGYVPVAAYRRSYRT